MVLPVSAMISWAVKLIKYKTPGSSLPHVFLKKKIIMTKIPNGLNRYQLVMKPNVHIVNASPFHYSVSIIE